MSTTTEPSETTESGETEHVFLALLLESVLTPLGVEVSSEARVMGAPPRADILLLRRQGAQWTRAQKARLPDGIRQYRAGHVLIEFKPDQSLGQDSLVQILCYDHHYRNAQNINPNQLRSVLVTARTPRRRTLNQYSFFKSELPGVYASTNPTIWHLGLIVLNDLADTPHNACFKVFASRMSRKQKAIDFVVQQIMPKLPAKQQLILAALFNLWTQAETGGDIMKTNITPDYMYQVGKKLFDDYVASLPPEERLKGLNPEERLKGLNPEERLKGLKPKDIYRIFRPDDLLKELDPEERLKGLDPQVIEAWLEKTRAAH